jgi:hypothetical protein
MGTEASACLPKLNREHSSLSSYCTTFLSWEENKKKLARKKRKSSPCALNKESLEHYSSLSQNHLVTRILFNT